MNEIRTTIAVAGAGASGMAAAIAAAGRIGGSRVLLLEKNAEAGKKILATGNGRCNFTNRLCTAADFSGAYQTLPGKQEAEAGFPGSVMAQAPPQRIMEFFETIGVLSREEEEGRVYPYSGQGASVRRALCCELERLGVKCLAGSAVKKAELLSKAEIQDKTDLRGREKFRLTLENGAAVRCEKLILAVGGKAGCQYGSSGDGYRLAQSLGHRIIKPIPALVGLLSREPFLPGVKGVRVRAAAKLYRDGRLLCGDRGEVQFTENGLSGICILNMSRYVRYSGNPQTAPEHYTVKLDFMEGKSAGEVLDMLLARRKYLAAREAPVFLDGILPEKLAAAVWERAAEKDSGRVADITDRQLECIAGELKAFAVSIDGTRSWKDAQVTAGGVDTEEIFPDTLGSRIVPGLYLAGELVDVDAPCGGYNLQWAFASGLTAGSAAAENEVQES